MTATTQNTLQSAELSATPPKIHIAYLDTIRGLAALTVVSEHFIIAYDLPVTDPIWKHRLDYSPLHFWWDGIAAVSMFFVLSGLVLSLKYFRSGPELSFTQFHLPGFIVNRLCRIWLPYCAILLISALLYSESIKSPALPTLLTADTWITQMWRGHPLDTMAMWREAFLLHLPGLVVLIPQSWTLEIELVLSLLLPVGLLLIQRGSAWLVFFGIFSVSFLHVSVFLLHFMLGLLLAKYFTLLKAFSSRYRWRRWCLLLVGLFCYTAADTLNTRLNDTGLWLFSGTGAGLILIYTLGSERTQTILAQPGLRHIGKVSYSLYLIHMVVLICVTPYFLHWLEVYVTQHFLLWLAGWASTIALSILLAGWSYHWLEMPSMTLGRYLSSIANTRFHL